MSDVKFPEVTGEPTVNGRAMVPTKPGGTPTVSTGGLDTKSPDFEKIRRAIDGWFSADLKMETRVSRATDDGVETMVIEVTRDHEHLRIHGEANYVVELTWYSPEGHVVNSLTRSGETLSEALGEFTQYVHLFAE